MKKIQFLLLILLVPTIVFTQTQSLNNFYRQHKKMDNVRNFRAPGFLIKMGTGIAQIFVKDEEVKMGLKLGSKIRNARILFSEEKTNINPKDVTALIKAVKKESFDELLTVRDGESNHIHILIRERKNKIKNLLIFIKGEDEFIMLSMKTNVKLKKLSKFINTMMKRSKKKKLEKEQEQRPKEKEHIPIPNPPEDIRA